MKAIRLIFTEAGYASLLKTVELRRELAALDMRYLTSCDYLVNGIVKAIEDGEEGVMIGTPEEAAQEKAAA